MSEFSSSETGFDRFLEAGAFAFAALRVVCVVFLDAAFGLGAAAAFFGAALVF
jgi:hypothetical protein